MKVNKHSHQLSEETKLKQEETDCPKFRRHPRVKQRAGKQEILPFTKKNTKCIESLPQCAVLATQYITRKIENTGGPWNQQVFFFILPKKESPFVSPTR